MDRNNFGIERIGIMIMLMVASALNWQCSTSKQAGSATDDPVLQSAWPSEHPDHIILNLTESPSTSVAVSWRTALAEQQGTVQYAVAGHGPGFSEGASEIAAESQPLKSTKIPANYHSAVLTGLTPGETYVYRVGSRKAWSEWFQFSQPADEGPFTFIYFGDAQNDIKSMWSRVIREAYAHMPKAAFMLHAGDLVNRFNSDTEWDEWFEAGSFIHSMIPGVMTPGNHEYRTGDLSPQWRPQFTLPENGPPGLEETCYFTDYRDMRIISLDSDPALNGGPALSSQRDWLEKVLRENTSKWIVVTLHHPLYATKGGRDNDVLRDNFKPLFDKYGVDLVLQGHDHAYGRGHNVPTGANTVSGSPGTVYVVSVSGPKMYELQEQDWMTRKAKNTQLFQLITVDGNVVRYEAYTARGELYDAFEIIKDAAGKRIVDHIPDFPELLD